MKSSLRHQALYNTLRDWILAGKYAAGAKLPSEQELQKQFGISRTTVMHALSDLREDGLIWRKQGAGSFVKLAEQTKFRLGLMIPGIGLAAEGSIFPMVQNQIVRHAAQIGWQVLMGDSEMPSQTDASGRRPVEVARRLIDHGVNAVAFVPFGITNRGDAYNHNVLAELQSANIPVVLLGADIVNSPDRSEYDVIGLDDEHAGFLLGRHLLTRGCKCFGFVRLSARFPAGALRLTGLQAAAKTVRGVTCHELILERDGVDDETLPVAIQKLRCDAVIGENDETAALAMGHLLNASVKIPEQIKVAGFDNAPITELLPIPLTSVAQPEDDFATEVISALRERIRAPSKACRWIRLHGRLVARKSTCK